jgi:hypothetical protein
MEPGAHDQLSAHALQGFAMPMQGGSRKPPLPPPSPGERKKDSVDRPAYSPSVRDPTGSENTNLSASTPPSLPLSLSPTPLEMASLPIFTTSVADNSWRVRSIDSQRSEGTSDLSSLAGVRLDADDEAEMRQDMSALQKSVKVSLELINKLREESMQAEVRSRLAEAKRMNRKDEVLHLERILDKLVKLQELRENAVEERKVSEGNRERSASPTFAGSSASSSPAFGPQRLTTPKVLMARAVSPSSRPVDMMDPGRMPVEDMNKPTWKPAGPQRSNWTVEATASKPTSQPRFGILRPEGSKPNEAESSSTAGWSVQKVVPDSPGKGSSGIQKPGSPRAVSIQASPSNDRARTPKSANQGPNSQNTNDKPLTPAAAAAAAKRQAMLEGMSQTPGTPPKTPQAASSITSKVATPTKDKTPTKIDVHSKPLTAAAALNRVGADSGNVTPSPRRDLATSSPRVKNPEAKADMGSPRMTPAAIAAAAKREAQQRASTSGQDTSVAQAKESSHSDAALRTAGPSTPRTTTPTGQDAAGKEVPKLHSAVASSEARRKDDAAVVKQTLFVRAQDDKLTAAATLLPGERNQGNSRAPGTLWYSAAKDHDGQTQLTETTNNLSVGIGQSPNALQGPPTGQNVPTSGQAVQISQSVQTNPNVRLTNQSTPTGQNVSSGQSVQGTQNAQAGVRQSTPTGQNVSSGQSVQGTQSAQAGVRQSTPTGQSAQTSLSPIGQMVSTGQSPRVHQGQSVQIHPNARLTNQSPPDGQSTPTGQSVQTNPNSRLTNQSAPDGQSAPNTQPEAAIAPKSAPEANNTNSTGKPSMAEVNKRRMDELLKEQRQREEEVRRLTQIGMALAEELKTMTESPLIHREKTSTVPSDLATQQQNDLLRPQILFMDDARRDATALAGSGPPQTVVALGAQVR